MSDVVKIPFTKSIGETATLLLAAAEELGVGSGAVRTGSGHFLVSQEVADKAGVDHKPAVQSLNESDTKKAPAKKSTTKKAAAKKSAASDKE